MQQNAAKHSSHCNRHEENAKNSMELQNKKRKLIKSTENLFCPFTCVDGTHATMRHIRQINVAESMHRKSAKIAHDDNDNRNAKKSTTKPKSFLLPVLIMH